MIVEPGLMWNRIRTNTKKLRKMGFIASIQNKIKGNRTRKKTVKFQTSFQCNGCIQRVKPHLDKISGIESWEVNVQNSKRVLKVRVPATDKEAVSQEVIQAVEKEGYEAEKLN
jgi:copper chaperone